MKGPVEVLLAGPCFQRAASLVVRLVRDTKRPSCSLDVALHHQRLHRVRGSGDRETLERRTVDNLVMTAGT